MAMKLEKMELPTVAKIESLSHEDLIELTKNFRERLDAYQGILFRMRKYLFGRKSEKTASTSETTAQDPEKKAPKPRDFTTKLPSERYPDAPVKIENIDFTEPPDCPACGCTMQDSGMTEDCEYLTTEPKEFIIVRQRRHKHRCQKCHGAIVTATLPDRIVPSGTYGDEMIIDATLSKYCDLVPMERYCQIAARSGILGIPPQSLIQTTHNLATYFKDVYQLIKQSTLDTRVLLADETRHRMLEGDPKKNWFLWRFSNGTSCFFECHDTRSGDISTQILSESRCEVLLSDEYSGYKKSVALVNVERNEAEKTLIATAYCNAHARREFISDQQNIDDLPPDPQYMVAQYKKIYKMEKESKATSPEEIIEARALLKPIFEEMRNEALNKVGTYSSKSQMAVAYNYFLRNYDGLTLFLNHHDIPIDNNLSERLLRSHVVGRKTWYGTHSRKGAETAAVHFTIVESCKLSGVNPREYYLNTVQRIQMKQKILTPHQFKIERQTNTC